VNDQPQRPDGGRIKKKKGGGGEKNRHFHLTWGKEGGNSISPFGEEGQGGTKSSLLQAGKKGGKIRGKKIEISPSQRRKNVLLHCYGKRRGVFIDLPTEKRKLLNF